MQILPARSLKAIFTPFRWLGLAVALLFFMLQATAFTHNAEHGFGKHSHAGKTCAVYEYCDHLTFDDAQPPAAAPILLSTAFPPAVSFTTLTELSVVTAAQPRAPPAQA